MHVASPHRSAHVAILVAAAAALATMPACTRPSQPKSVVVRDSAGVTIVDGSFDDRLVVNWELSDTPEIVIPSTGPGYQLFGVKQMATLRDKSVAVLNQGNREVLVFDTLGGLVRTIGRVGDGPGEFQRPQFLARILPDSLLVIDLDRQNGIVFLEDGRYVRSFRMEPPPAPPPYAFPFGVSERLLLAVHGQVATADGGEPGRRLLPVRIAVYDLEGRVQHFFGTAGVTEVLLYETEGSLRSTSPPLRIETYLAASAGHLVLARSDLDEVRIIAPQGDLTRLLRWTGAVRPLTETEGDSTIAAWVDAPTSVRGKQVRTDLAGGIRLPRTWPPIHAMQVDSEGLVWVGTPIQTGESRQQWLVLGDGGPGAVISIPSRLAVLEIGHDHVAGVVTSELGEETLVVYGLKRVAR